MYKVIILLILTYLYILTGLHSDDYIFLSIVSDKSLNEVFSLVFSTVLYLKNTIVILFDFLQFYFFKIKHIVMYDLVKVLTSFLTFYIMYKFSQQYLSKNKALLFSFIFILYPIHDATNYWVMGQYIMISLSIIALSHILINKERFTIGFMTGVIGAFSSYSSLPFSFGLSFIFLIEKQYKKFIIFVIPQLLYIIYFFTISKLFNTQAIKGSSDFNVTSLFKQYILQIGTFLDSTLGPSFWLKVYYSVTQITLPSLLIVIILVILFYKYFKVEKCELNKPLLVSFIMISLLAFGIFSLTGLYPQIAFNLGNRVTIYGSLLISYLLVIFFMNSKKISTVVFSIFLLSIFGISDHWKAWNKIQLELLNNIKTNKELKNFDKTKQLFVTNNQYSKLGDLSHIEFFAQGMAKYIFKQATNQDYKVSTLNRRFVYKDTYLLDTKYGVQVPIDKVIYVYDSKSDKLLSIKNEDIKEYIDTLPKDNRHWIQLLDKNNFIVKIVLTLMPRLEYAL